MESILNAQPNRATDPIRRTPQQGMRGSIICTVLGLAAVAIGSLMWSAGSGEPQGTGLEEPVRAIGGILLTIGIPLFVGALLVEFFAIGSALRAIAASSEATASLLRENLGSGKG